MSEFTRRFVALCLPPLVAWGVDCGLTLSGQSEAYWARVGPKPTDGISSLHSYTAAVNEVAPTARHLLALHPAAYIAGTVLEMAALCALILLLPSNLAFVTCLAATLGHTWGATTWLSRFPHGYQLGNAFFLFVAVLIVAGVQWWYAEGRPERLFAPRMPRSIRAVSVGLAAAVFVYMYLWPHSN